jgi:hypothetical protein
LEKQSSRSPTTVSVITDGLQKKADNVKIGMIVTGTGQGPTICPKQYHIKLTKDKMAKTTT